MKALTVYCLISTWWPPWPRSSAPCCCRTALWDLSLSPLLLSRVCNYRKIMSSQNPESKSSEAVPCFYLEIRGSVFILDFCSKLMLSECVIRNLIHYDLRGMPHVTRVLCNSLHRLLNCFRIFCTKVTIHIIFCVHSSVSLLKSPHIIIK